MEAKYDVIIVGAGISGLICAIELEKRNYKPLIIEATDRVGGRVKTDQTDGWPLDHGFQVLLTEYPEAKAYLDYEALDLKYFKPGAVIFNENKKYSISDPLREPSSVLKMLFSPVGSLADKLRMAKLTQTVKKKTLEDIFNSPEKTTQEYLQEKGFSDKILSQFFKPFFGGIYLENELNTPSRMFEYVFKMFSIGQAAIPSKGIEEIPKQLKSKLKNTTFRFDTSVEKIDTQIHLKNGEKLQVNKVIIATQPEQLIGGLGEPPRYQSVANLYFKCKKSVLDQPAIALVPEERLLINNFYEINQLAHTPGSDKLISVSVNEFEKEKNLEMKVAEELAQLTNQQAADFEHIKTFTIYKALPEITDLKNEMQPSAVKLNDNIYLAGDYLLNGSLNAAMKSGRIAAEAVANSL